MAKPKGMDAVIEKSSAANKRRKPAMKRKGPGIAIMIAMGAPKKGMMEQKRERMGAEMQDELDASKGEGMSKAKKIAALEEKIGYLKAELALLKADESDMEDEMASEDEAEDEMEDEED